ncbi:MAG: hypothetical protein EU535_02000 [Promethearchaeota archaeon]|nr:MAG: hypothetical protein EU535_02000 [Candidatus Lokiarchaeota archaeon]
MPSTLITCPTCNKSGKIEILEEKMREATKGLLAINIASNIICEHSFIVYIDRNLTIRDYFVADFHIDIPKIESIERIKETNISSKDILDVDLIKLNLHALALSIILKSIFLKKKIILLLDQDFLYKHIYSFFKYITKDAFEINILLITSDEYKNTKKQYKDAIVLEQNKIVQNPKKVINLRNLDVEKNIVNQFLIEPELGYSYIFLKNQIYKAYELSKAIYEFAKNQDNKKEINIFKIAHFLEELYGIKIDLVYLEFLINIVSNYFGIEIPSASESFLGGL